MDRSSEADVRADRACREAVARDQRARDLKALQLCSTRGVYTPRRGRQGAGARERSNEKYKERYGTPRANSADARRERWHDYKD